jgi:hypothetical protein
MKISREVRHDITLRVSDSPLVQVGDGLRFPPVKIQITWWEQRTSPHPRAHVTVTGPSTRRGQRVYPDTYKFNLYGTRAKPCPIWLIKVVRQVGYTGWIETSVPHTAG